MAKRNATQPAHHRIRCGDGSLVGASLMDSSLGLRLSLQAFLSELIRIYKVALTPSSNVVSNLSDSSSDSGL